MRRDFKGVWIPREIWLDESLSLVEKCLLTEIESLDFTENHCFASNGYFSKFLGVSVPTVTRGLKKLEKRGLIECLFLPTGRVIKMIIPLIKMMRTPNQNDETPPNQNDEHNNREYINNTTKENINGIPFSAIINFLNNETGKRYKSSSEKTKSLIRARWAEGFREPDFHEVIQKKNKEWAGTEWEQYLRPATIFGPKFEGYLNQQSTGTVEIGSLSSQEEKKAWLDYRANHGNPPRTVKALHAFMGRTE